MVSFSGAYPFSPRKTWRFFRGIAIHWPDWRSPCHVPRFRGIAVHCRIVVSDCFAILEWVSSSNSGIVATFVLKNLKKTVQKWQEKQRK